MTIFYNLLANNAFAGVTNFTVWFAITFFVFLETKSVFATGIIAGIFLLTTAVSGFWFGSLVDHYKKKQVMLGSSLFSLVIYIVAFIMYLSVDPQNFKNPASIILWIFVPLVMAGVMVGNIRNIALPTMVTLLFPPKKRDKANGLVGTVTGVSFLITSVISGLLVGFGGMYYVLLLAILVTALVIVHLVFIKVTETKIVHSENQPKNIDIKGNIKIVSTVPGLFPLIFFTTFNNFLGGVFMALMDAYGLSLVSVQVWGFMWGVLSTGFIIGGAIIAKKGLGKNPLKTLFLANFVIWTISSFFTIQPSITLLAGGMFIYLCVIPAIEASEQTILQKVVPHERQGRVFGFAQSLEQAASPLTAFMIGPITQIVFIPFMTSGRGANIIGSWYGVTADRGIALVFTLTGLIGLFVTFVAFRSKYYKRLSAQYLKKS